MKKNQQENPRHNLCGMESGFRDELAKIVSEIVNAPKGTPFTGSQPIRRDV